MSLLPEREDRQERNHQTQRQQSACRRQNYLCRHCHKRFNERTNTPMARLRTRVGTVAAAINVRGEGLGVRATGRSFAKSHATIIRWEKRLQEHESQWSPAVPEQSDVTLEGDELYTRVSENLPPL